MSARVADVMTRNVVAVRGQASFKEIAATLRNRRISVSGPWSGLLHRHELEKARGVTAAQLMSGPAARDRLDHLSAPPVHVFGPLA